MRYNGAALPGEEPDGTRTVFSTANQYKDGSLRMWINSKRVLTDQFTEDGLNRQFSMVLAPTSGTVLTFDYIPI